MLGSFAMSYNTCLNTATDRQVAQMTDRYFTLEEAQELVSRLEETFQAVAPLREKAKRLYEEVKNLQRRMRSNGGPKASEELASRRRALEEASEHIEAEIQPLRDLGVVIKDIEQGLVDFPNVREGRVVFLCWLAGEPEVRFWHELSTGFAGRQPL